MRMKRAGIGIAKNEGKISYSNRGPSHPQRLLCDVPPSPATLIERTWLLEAAEAFPQRRQKADAFARRRSPAIGGGFAAPGTARIPGQLAASPVGDVAGMVTTYIMLAEKSKKERVNRNAKTQIVAVATASLGETDKIHEKELKRSKRQKTAVFFLCAAIMAQPYDTPLYVPAALAAISKHSFERNAPLGVRDIVKRCCADYKKTHMSDNWDVHRAVFSQDQLEALEDVVSSPHYYA